MPPVAPSQKPNIDIEPQLWKEEGDFHTFAEINKEPTRPPSPPLNQDFLKEHTLMNYLKFESKVVDVPEYRY